MEGYRGHTGSNIQDFDGCCSLYRHTYSLRPRAEPPPGTAELAAAGRWFAGGPPGGRWQLQVNAGRGMAAGDVSDYALRRSETPAPVAVRGVRPTLPVVTPCEEHAPPPARHGLPRQVRGGEEWNRVGG